MTDPTCADLKCSAHIPPLHRPPCESEGSSTICPAPLKVPHDEDIPQADPTAEYRPRSHPGRRRRVLPRLPGRAPSVPSTRVNAGDIPWSVKPLATRFPTPVVELPPVHDGSPPSDSQATRHPTRSTPHGGTLGRSRASKAPPTPSPPPPNKSKPPTASTKIARSSISPPPWKNCSPPISGPNSKMADLCATLLQGEEFRTLP